MQTTLTCPCGATAKDTTKERGRFLYRHPDAGKVAVSHVHEADIQAGKARYSLRIAQERQAAAKRREADAALIAAAMVASSLNSRSARNA